MKEMLPVLETKNLNIGHRDPKSGKINTILENLNFKIYRGDMICLMGPNGCGKTTLFRSLAGILPYFTGEILIKDRPICQYSRNDFAKLVSIVLTDRIEISRMTVEEIVALGRFPYLSFLGRLTKFDQMKIDNALEILGLVDMKLKQITELSDGQKQKVFIARALAQDTPILLLDEPTTFLDIQRKMEILSLLKKISREKKVATLFSSHDWELALELSTRVWIVDNEGKLRDGMPEDLILNGDLESCFENNQFEFDRGQGKFKEKISKIFTVNIAGTDEVRLFWAQHALNKVGVEVRRINSVDRPLINVMKNKWELKMNGNSHYFLNLTELLNALKIF